MSSNGWAPCLLSMAAHFQPLYSDLGATHTHRLGTVWQKSSQHLDKSPTVFDYQL